MTKTDRRRFNGAKCKAESEKLTHRFTLICSPEFKELLENYKPMYGYSNAKWLRHLLVSGSKLGYLIDSFDIDNKTCRISIRLNSIDAALVSDRSAEGIRKRICTGFMYPRINLPTKYFSDMLYGYRSDKGY